MPVPNEAAVDDRLLTPKVAAQLLSVHWRSLCRWSQAGRVPCVRVGGCVRFRLSDISKIMLTGVPAE